MIFLYICFPIYIGMCLPLTVTLLFEELLSSYMYILAPLLCPSPVLQHRRLSQKCHKRQEVREKQAGVCACVGACITSVREECTGQLRCLSRAGEKRKGDP